MSSWVYGSGAIISKDSKSQISVPLTGWHIVDEKDKNCAMQNTLCVDLDRSARTVGSAVV